MKENNIEDQYRLITEDSSTLEEKIDYLKMLYEKVSKEKKQEILELIQELEKRNTD